MTVTWQGCQKDGICYPTEKKTLAALEGAASLPAAAPTAGGIVLAEDEGLVASRP